MVHLLEFPEGMLWMGSAYFKTRAPGCAYIFCFSLFFFSIPFIFALSFSLPPCRNSDPGSHSRLFSPSTHYGSCLAFFSREDFSSSLVDSRRIGVFIYIYIYLVYHITGTSYVFGVFILLVVWSARTRLFRFTSMVPSYGSSSAVSGCLFLRNQKPRNHLVTENGWFTPPFFRTYDMIRSTPVSTYENRSILLLRSSTL